MGANADWSDRFASAPVDAMQVYDDIFVPGLFIPWANVLLDEVALAAHHLGPLVYDGKLHSASASNIVVARA